MDRFRGAFVPAIALVAAAALAVRCTGQEMQRPLLLPPTEHLPSPTPAAQPYVRPMDWVLQPFSYGSSSKSPADWKPFTDPAYDGVVPIDLAMALRLVIGARWTSRLPASRFVRRPPNTIKRNTPGCRRSESARNTIGTTARTCI